MTDEVKKEILTTQKKLNILYTRSKARSRRGFAKFIGMSVPTTIYWLNGQRKPSLKAIRMIQKAFMRRFNVEVPIEDIITEE